MSFDFYIFVDFHIFVPISVEAGAVHATFKILALIDNCTARLENDWQLGLFKILNDAILQESF